MTENPTAAQLDEARERVTEIERALEAAYEARDRLVRAAYADGVAVPHIQERLGVSRQRIYQIVGKQTT